MSFLTIYYDDSNSAELGELLTTIKPNVELYTTSKEEAQRQRMLIIGQVSEYKRLHSQRSSEHRRLNKAMEEEGWSHAAISENTTAYQEYKYLKENVNEPIKQFAEGAPIKLLLECGKQRKQSGDSELSAAAFDHWRKTGCYPTKKQFKGFLGGYTSSSFEFRGGGKPASLRPGENSEPKGYDSWDTPASTLKETPTVYNDTIEDYKPLKSAHVEEEDSTDLILPETPAITVSATTTTTTVEETALLDELNTIFSAYEAVVKAHRQEIKDSPRALAVVQCLSTFNSQWLNIEPSRLRR